MADPDEFEALYELEKMTNPRITEIIGNIDLVPREEWVLGEGSTAIMAPFFHPRTEGDRFTDSKFGAFYASNSLDCAIHETAYHQQKWFTEIDEPAGEIEMRVYCAEIQGEFTDIREQQKNLPAVYDLSDYTESQTFARKIRSDGGSGIVFTSVRYPDGENVAVFIPKSVKRCRDHKYLKYRWDGSRITDICELSGAKMINYPEE